MQCAKSVVWFREYQLQLQSLLWLQQQWIGKSAPKYTPEKWACLHLIHLTREKCIIYETGLCIYMREDIRGLSSKYPAMQREKQRHLLKKIHYARSIVHRTVTPQSPSRQAPWDLTQFSQSLSAAPLYIPESHRQSEICSLSKVILVLGKDRSHRVPNLGCSAAESSE